MEKYSEDFDGVYPTRLDQLTPKYLKTLPNCPAAGKMTYTLETGPNAQYNKERYENYYHVECHGNHHEKIVGAPNFPNYNGVVGLQERP